MLLLVNVTAASACAPTVSEVAGESDSNAIVASSGSKRFQAIVPVFYDKDGKYRSLAPAKNKESYSYICLYKIEWSDISSQHSQTYKTNSEELLTKRGPLEIGTFAKKAGDLESKASISRGAALILGGQAEYGTLITAADSSRPKPAVVRSPVAAADAANAETVDATVVTKAEFNKAMAEVRNQDEEQFQLGFPCHRTLPPFNSLKQRNDFFNRLSAGKAAR
jgi:hypothetical protein